MSLCDHVRLRRSARRRSAHKGRFLAITRIPLYQTGASFTILQCPLAASGRAGLRTVRLELQGGDARQGGIHKRRYTVRIP